MNIYQKVDDTRANIGVGTQLNIWDDTLGENGKYRLFIPLETVPSVVGSTETVEVDLLTSSIKTKIEGKSTVDDVDVEFLWHRDNLKRLREAEGEEHKFLISYPDYTGWKFTGKIKYRPNEATSDKLTGTITIIASSVDEHETEDVRDVLAKTCVIDTPLPAALTLKKSSDPYKYKVSSTISGATFTAKSTSDTIASADVPTSTSGDTKELTITPKAKGYCIVEVTASATGYASWTTTIAVEVEE